MFIPNERRATPHGRIRSATRKDGAIFPQSGVRARLCSVTTRRSRGLASGEDSLVGTWRDARGRKRGTLLIHADGSFFAEFDVIREHPRDARWFVKAVTAWGRGAIIRSEPRLLPVVN